MRVARPPASSRPVIEGVTEAGIVTGRRGAARQPPMYDISTRLPALSGAALPRAQLRIAVGAGLPDAGDRSRDLRVARAAAHQRAQVVAARCEQAQVQLAFGRQPRACSRRRRPA
jgi:hypothetical protein